MFVQGAGGLIFLILLFYTSMAIVYSISGLCQMEVHKMQLQTLVGIPTRVLLISPYLVLYR